MTQPPILHCLDVVTSTHTLACDLARQKAPHGEAITARAQTEGRGRLGRVWRSPSGFDHLYLSVVTRFPWKPQSLTCLPLLVGVWTAEALEEEVGVRASLKWPNDLTLEGRKLGGILCEYVSDAAAVVVSLGLNIGGTSQDLDAHLTPHAITLAEAGVPVWDGLQARLAQKLILKMEPTPAAPSDLISRWMERACLPSAVALEDGQTGTAIGLADNGALRVSLDSGGEHLVHAGEVRWITLAAQYRP